jgi:hypothetical protein
MSGSNLSGPSYGSRLVTLEPVSEPSGTSDDADESMNFRIGTKMEGKPTEKLQREPR